MQICAGSAPLLFAALIVQCIKYSCYIWNFVFISSFSIWAALRESYLAAQLWRQIFLWQSLLSRNMTKPTKWVCAQQRLRSTWASAQSDQSFRCTLNGKLRTEAFFMRTAKTPIRLNRCRRWSESSLGAHVILLVLSCCDSFILPYWSLCSLQISSQILPVWQHWTLSGWTLFYCEYQTHSRT